MNCKTKVVPVPGFGFLCEDIRNLIDNKFQDFLSNFSEDERSRLTVDQTDNIKCNSVIIPSWREFFPLLSGLEDQEVCLPKWDNASCIPPVRAGEMSIFPCMTKYMNSTFSPDYNASLECQLDGSWASRTSYGDCICHSYGQDSYPDFCHQQHIESEEDSTLELSMVFYFAGYIMSFLATVLAVIIFFSFRQRHCLRHKIHTSLFMALCLSSLNWIVTNRLPELSMYMGNEFSPLVCSSLVLSFFFHLACFYWMSLEGLYLLLQVQFPLSLSGVKYRHFILFGWGGPVLNICIWVGVRLHHHGEDNCPFLTEGGVDIFTIHLPIYIILSINTVLLVWIMTIVISKLRQSSVADHDKRHWKATKAMLVVMPVLGSPYLLTLLGPSRNYYPTAYTVFQTVRSMLLSTQGLVICLPYCFLNTEVRSIMSKKWERWRMTRNVGVRNVREESTSGTSVTHLNQRRESCFQV